MPINYKLSQISFSWLFLSLLISLSACQTTKSIAPKERRQLHQLVTSSPVLNKSFTGFALYDPEATQWLYQQDAHKYYTPASNTKILTLYTALEILGDSFPLIHYEKRQDSLIFWGSGNPALLDPSLPLATDALAFLQKHNGPLFFTHAAFTDKRFGSGWAWDDYTYSYQAEKTALPLYGNLVQFSRDSTNDVVQIWPRWFAKGTSLDTSPTTAVNYPIIMREEDSNSFRLNESAYSKANYRRSVPFHHEPRITMGLLQDTLDRNIYYLPDFVKKEHQSLINSRPDTLYRKLMQQSDNFIAEQLLLMCSDKVLGEMNTAKIIRYAKDSLFSDIPDALEWVDGSGLSRYNLFTPRSMVHILEKLYRKKSKDWIFSIFPTGGEGGTIRNWYAPSAGQSPFIFAKTGTLRHRHCLSGYVQTQSGKTLIFSFMHNNFTQGSAPMKKEMDRILRWINKHL